MGLQFDISKNMFAKIDGDLSKKAPKGTGSTTWKSRIVCFLDGSQTKKTGSLRKISRYVNKSISDDLLKSKSLRELKNLKANVVKLNAKIPQFNTKFKFKKIPFLLLSKIFPSMRAETIETSKLDDLISQGDTLAIRLDAIKPGSDTADKTIQSLEDEIEKAEAMKQVLVLRLKELSSDSKAGVWTIQQLQTEIRAAEATKEVLVSRLKELSSDSKARVGTIQQLQIEMNAAKNQHKDLATRFAALTGGRPEEGKSIPDLESAIETAQATHQRLAAALNAINPNINTKNKTIQEMEDEIKELNNMRLLKEGVTDSENFIDYAINDIPVADRDNVIAHALPLIKDITDGAERGYILTAIRDIPAADRADVIGHANPLIKSVIDGTQRAYILTAIRKMSAASRAKDLNYKLLLKEGVTGHGDLIDCAIDSIPADDRANVIAHALPLIKGITDGHCRIRILDEIRKIPAADRADVIGHANPLIKSVTDGTQRAYILTTIRDIPADDRADVIGHALPLIKDRKCERIICAILGEISKISVKYRAEVIKNATSATGEGDNICTGLKRYYENFGSKLTPEEVSMEIKDASQTGQISQKLKNYLRLNANNSGNDIDTVLRTLAKDSPEALSDFARSIDFPRRSYSPEIDVTAESLFFRKLLDFAGVKDLKLAQKAIIYAAEYNDATIAEKCLTCHPHKQLERVERDGYRGNIITEDPMAIAVRMGSLSVAKMMVEKNFRLEYEEEGYVSTSQGNICTDFLNLLRALKNPSKEEVISFFKLLLEKGAGGEGYIFLQGGKEQSLGEVLWFFTGNNADIAKELFDYVIIEKKETVPLSVVPELKTKQMIDKYKDILIEQKHITAEVAALIEKEGEIKKASTGGLTLELSRQTDKVKKLLRIHNSNLSLIQFKEIEDFRKLKKEAKEHLKGKNQEGDLKTLQDTYDTFAEAYDQLVTRHVLLRELREVSQEIRSLQDRETKPSLRLSRLYSMWGPEGAWARSTSERHLPRSSDSNRKMRWDNIRKRIFHAAEKVQSEDLWKQHRIQWMHGTKSGALPSLFATKAILPAAMLFNSGVAAFSGELCGSHEAINRENISGERLTKTWEEGDSLYFDTNTRFLMNLFYASSITSGTTTSHKMIFESKNANEKLKLDNFKAIISRGSNEDRAHARMDIIRLRTFDENADTTLLPVKAYVDEALKAKETSEEKKLALKMMQDALNVKIINKIPDDQRDLILAPFPIIFASTTLESFPESFYEREFLVTGEAKIGRDLQVAFTKAENIERLQKLLGSYGIKVFDIDTALYLEMQQMMIGSIDTKFEKEIQKARMSPEVQELERIAHHIPKVLSLYAQPFPKEPTYIENGESITVHAPFYGGGFKSFEEYHEAVAEGTAIARSIHGQMHASRVAILSQILAKVYKASGEDIQSPLYLTLAAATHDAARQDEGEDHWDDVSGEMVKRLLQSFVLPKGEVERYQDALRERDPKDNIYSSTEQKIIHDADAIEILRVLSDKNDFKYEKLCIDKEKIEGVVEEWSSFIEITESPAIKLWIEQNSDNAYLSTIMMISYVQEKTGEIPKVAELLKSEIEHFQKKYPMPDELQKLLDNILMLRATGLLPQSH